MDYIVPLSEVIEKTMTCRAISLIEPAGDASLQGHLS